MIIRCGSFPKPGMTLVTPEYSSTAEPANTARKAIPTYTGVLEGFPSSRGISNRSSASKGFMLKFYQFDL
jgi:hypothetical protein